MTLWDAGIKGNFLSEPGGTIEASMDLSMGGENWVRAEFPEDENRCVFCGDIESDTKGTRCAGAEDGEHAVAPEPLAWIDQVKVVPDAEDGEVKVLVQMAHKTGQARIRLAKDPETGRMRLSVDTTTGVLPIEQAETDGRTTHFLIG